MISCGEDKVGLDGASDLLVLELPGIERSRGSAVVLGRVRPQHLIDLFRALVAQVGAA
jgi:hypothetical protein